MGKGGQGTKRKFIAYSDEQLHTQLAHVCDRMGALTFKLQEGKLMQNNKGLKRPHRSLPMFVGVLLTGFGGDWITQASCNACGRPHNTACCCWCQCGICEQHGLLLARAPRADGSGEWQGSSLACCGTSKGCEERQRQVLEFWKPRTGEELK